ncbi:hypothetical protein ACMGDK_11585 [Chryseobacterium sp. DT-3]|uniref:hypothetical protein n=1 Tax=Chryseobacterium sp. DT-3 TaxID=3396164 RepID=UPI003F1BBE0F
MIETIEQLKEERPDLVELFEAMTRDQLLNQCYLECIDALNMEERVSVFMDECTINMSKTNYDTAVLRTFINQKKEYDINEFCYIETADEPTEEELLESILERAKEYKK